jgi:tetratricopeptide (TPR) repeat protein
LSTDEGVGNTVNAFEVDAGADAGSLWGEEAGPNGLPVAFRSLEVEREQALRSTSPYRPICLGTSLHIVGYCHANQGQYVEALPWFERAVAAKEKGDVHSRVEPERLGTSLRRVGDCYANLGKIGEAQPRFERASMVLKRGPDP